MIELAMLIVLVGTSLSMVMGFMFIKHPEETIILSRLGWFLVGNGVAYMVLLWVVLKLRFKS